MSQLRPYQLDLDRKIKAGWSDGARYCLATAPTGAGKTVTFAHILAEEKGAAVAIAHRQELVSQISLSLAREGVTHSVIAPRTLIQWIMRLHREELGFSFYDPSAQMAVAGVDTLNKRSDHFANWRQQVALWVMDEAHHVLTSNKWGKAVTLFPNARGLGVTATPMRADGKGLGAHADGVFDLLIEGPGMRELINAGYLSDYTIYVPGAEGLDLSHVPIGKSGEFVRDAAREAIHKSKIVGDVVKHYIDRAAGLPGITFAVDVESAHELATAYRAAGVPAAAVSAKTPERERHQHVRALRRGDIKQLVNVDLFGEGFDLPAICTTSFARPTASYPLYVQQFGRPLRPFEGHPRAIILDHVGNVNRHNGPPDVIREWSLDRRPTGRRGARDPDAIPYRTCVECTQPYEAVLTACPNIDSFGVVCGFPWVPEGRSTPQQVAGDLVELDAAALAELYGRRDAIDETPDELFDRMSYGGAPRQIAYAARAQHRKRQASQRSLRELMQLYGGMQRALGRSDREGMKRFYNRYGHDVLSAQSLGRPEAQVLACRLIDDIGRAAI